MLGALVRTAVCDDFVVCLRKPTILDNADHELKEFAEKGCILDLNELPNMLLWDYNDVGLPSWVCVLESQNACTLCNDSNRQAPAQNRVAIKIIVHSGREMMPNVRFNYKPTGPHDRTAAYAPQRQQIVFQTGHTEFFRWTLSVIGSNRQKTGVSVCNSPTLERSLVPGNEGSLWTERFVSASTRHISECSNLCTQ